MLNNQIAPSSGTEQPALQPSPQQLDEMGFKVMLVCAALLFIDFQYNALSSPLNALVLFHYMLMPLLSARLTSQYNGSVPIAKCFNLVLISCNVHRKTQRGEPTVWTAECVCCSSWMCLAQGQCENQCFIHILQVFQGGRRIWTPQAFFPNSPKIF